AALMGLSGALFAHKIAYLAPDIFSILLSIQFLLLVIVGGLGSLHGTVFCAVFVALLPPVIPILRDSIPICITALAAATHIGVIGQRGAANVALADDAGDGRGIFVLILVQVIPLAPLRLYRRWVNMRISFSTIPTYKASTFKLQKT